MRILAGRIKVTFAITMVQDEDGMFIVECPAIIRGAIRDCLAARRELGLPLTIDVRQHDGPD